MSYDPCETCGSRDICIHCAISPSIDKKKVMKMMKEEKVEDNDYGEVWTGDKNYKIKETEDEFGPDIINYYEKLTKDCAGVTWKNPIEWMFDMPYRFCITGPTSKGKTNFLINLIKKGQNVDIILLVAKAKDEKLYKYVRKLFGDKCFAWASLNGFPTIEEIVEKHGIETRKLIVFDDMVNEKKSVQEKIADYFIRGRKEGIGCVYIAQTYFGIHKIIRQQCDKVALLGITEKGDIKRILKVLNQDIPDLSILVRMYEQCVEEERSAFIIDSSERNVNKRYRKGFGQAFRIKD